MTIPETSMMQLKPSEIFIPDTNFRSGKLPNIPELAAALKARGQLQPVGVRPGSPDPKKPYTLTFGFRRIAAWDVNGWNARPLLAVLKDKDENDSRAAILDNLSSNEYESPNSIDLADAIYALHEGTYEVGEEETAKPMDLKALEKETGFSNSKLRKLVQIASSLPKDVKSAAKKVGAPLRVIVAMSYAVGTGRTDEAKEESRHAKQLEILEEWAAHQKMLEAGGRQRKSPKKKSAKGGGDGDGEGEDKPIVSPTKKIDAKDRTTEDYIKALNLKLANAPAAEKRYIEGQLAASRFFAGEIKKFPNLGEDDFKAVAKAEAAEAKAAAKKSKKEEDEGEEES